MFLRGVENRAANRTSKSPSISLRLPFGVWCVVRRTPEKRRDNRENQPGGRAGRRAASPPSFLPSFLNCTAFITPAAVAAAPPPLVSASGAHSLTGTGLMLPSSPHALIARYMAEMGLDNVSGLTGPGWHIRTVKTFC